jgi:hypothetical protein
MITTEQVGVAVSGLHFFSRGTQFKSLSEYGYPEVSRLVICVTVPLNRPQPQTQYIIYTTTFLIKVKI